VQPTFPCPDCGKTFGQATSLRRHHQVHKAHAPPGPFACMECGQDFAQEAELHQHYIRHAQGSSECSPSPLHHDMGPGFPSFPGKRTALNK
jgi:predicted RNA-binding Zn-ribbon protein involved in translation (DUF1610 family)